MFVAAAIDFRSGSGGVWALEISKRKKNPFSIGFGGLFIGVGG